MLKKLTLKTLLTLEIYPDSRKMATMIGKYFPKLNSINNKRSPDVPPMLLNSKRSLKEFLPSTLANFHPGTLLKQFLIGWYNKIKNDYSDIAHSFNNKAEHYADAYYNWMERFIEMDYEADCFGQRNALVKPDGFLGKGTISNFSEKISHRFGYPAAKAKNALAGKFEKTLIGISRIFTPRHVFEIPMLEIVNASAIEGEVQANEKSFIRKRFLKWFFLTKHFSDKMACYDQSFAGYQPTDKYPRLLRWPEIFRKISSIRILKNLRGGAISENTLLTESFSVLPLIPGYNFPANIGSGFN